MMPTTTQPIQRAVGLLTLCATLGVLSAPAQAIRLEDVSDPRQQANDWVEDSADLLSVETEQQLNQMISELEFHNGAEIVIVTVPDTKTFSSPKAFATQLFNHWEVGKAGDNNGVLFAISKGDRRVEIETGYGIEPILPNAQVKQILETHILPKFKDNLFDEGTIAGTTATIDVLEAHTSFVKQADPNPPQKGVTDRQPTSASSINLSDAVRAFFSLILGFGGPIALIALFACALKNSNSSSSSRTSSSGSSISIGSYGGGFSSGGGSCGGSSGGSCGGGGGSSGGGGAGGGF